MDFTGKTIAIAITGGIAAYKACDLIRELYRRGAHRVICVMTPTAESFIPSLTLQALSRFPVYASELAVDHAGVPIHIVVAQQADALLIVPATVDTIAKLAHGTADNLVTTSAITFTGKPVLVAPAMNTRMWDNPLTRENLQKLRSLPNYTIIEPASGSLACGETGEGHLADPETILQAVYKAVHTQVGMFQGLRAVVTAGGTVEPIDPVRVISNRSSGKMGLALADELNAMGADVTLITTRPPVGRSYSVVPVQTSEEMKNALDERFEQTDLLFMAAAISDYKVQSPATQKIKRENQPETQLNLVANPDILAELGQRKRPGQLLVGFAAESNDLVQNATEKLRRKNLDAMVANDISRSDIGFESEHNEVTLLFPDASPQVLERASKTLIARRVLTLLYDKLMSNQKTKLKLVKAES
jgi:phosphopantothenoylcysteine decarboxylase/phosphopantothenate--cysteine ligase